ncbi:hypothetical protein [Humibacter sp.]|uniref:hypothetical protein n=1 Tax=Humibacter sp. TaxID=1940291 RepID=UPI003F7D9B6B
MGYEIAINEENIDEVANSVGCSTRQQLEEYLGMKLAPVTLGLVACALMKLPVTFDAVFAVL